MAAKKKTKKRGKAPLKQSLELKIIALQDEVESLRLERLKRNLDGVTEAELKTYFKVWSVFHHDWVAGAHATACEGSKRPGFELVEGIDRFAKLGR